MCTEKGPLIAGFLLFSSRISIIDPFHGLPWIRSSKGPDPGQKGVIRAQTGSKEAKYSPSEALRSLRALSNGYLDLSNSCSRYLELALATGLEQPKIQEPRSSFAAPYPCCPDRTRPIEPRGPFPYAARLRVRRCGYGRVRDRCTQE